MLVLNMIVFLLTKKAFNFSHFLVFGAMGNFSREVTILHFYVVNSQNILLIFRKEFEIIQLLAKFIYIYFILEISLKNIKL